MPPAGVSPRAPFCRGVAVRVWRGIPALPPRSFLDNTLCRFHACVNEKDWSLISGSMTGGVQFVLYFHQEYTPETDERQLSWSRPGRGSITPHQRNSNVSAASARWSDSWRVQGMLWVLREDFPTPFAGNARWVVGQLFWRFVHEEELPAGRLHHGRYDRQGPAYRMDHGVLHGTASFSV